jgi:hypothetical protein
VDLFIAILIWRLLVVVSRSPASIIVVVWNIISVIVIAAVIAAKIIAMIMTASMCIAFTIYCVLLFIPST